MFSKRRLTFRISGLCFFQNSIVSIRAMCFRTSTPEIIDIADVSDVARFCVRVSPKFRARLGRRPIRETRLIGISCAIWNRRFYRARNIPTASPLFSRFATHLEGIPRVAPATRFYSRSFSVSARKITSQPDITRWRSVLRAISFIPNAWVNWECLRLNIS